MAGVLLLYSKKESNSGEFNHVKNVFKKAVQAHFQTYFREIKYHDNLKNCFLVEFRKQNEPSKSYFDKSGSWLIYEGVVFALEQTKMYSSEELWQLYQNQGSQMANRLDGHFVIKLYDADADEYLIINDFDKTHTNFICETDDYVLVTPFLLLAAVIINPKPDYYALNEFLWRYYILSDRSILQNVRRLKSASLYSIKNNHLTLKHYWHWPKQYTSLSLEDNIQLLADSIQETARLIDQHFQRKVVEFTTGQDSRTVFAGFTSQKIDVETAIFGLDDDVEVINVKRMAQKYGFKTHHIKLQQDFLDHLFDYFKLAVTLGSCEEPGFMLGRIFYMKSSYLPFASCVVNGVHGRYYKDGLWNEQYVLNLYREPRRVNVDRLLKYRILNAKYRDDIFQDKFLEIKRNSAEYFTELLNRSRSGYEHAPVAIQLDKFDLECYANFGNVSNTTCNCAIDMLSPLLMRRNLEAALSMPPQWKYNLSKIQRGVVTRLDERLAREPTSLGNLDMLPKTGLRQWLFLIRYWIAQSSKFTGKIKKRLGMQVASQLQKTWDYLPIYKNLLTDPEIGSLIDPNAMVLREIIDSRRWQDYLESFSTTEVQRLDNYEFLYKLAGVEYFLRMADDCHDLNNQSN